MALTPEGIKSSLKQVKYPGFTRDIVSFGIVQSVEVDGSTVKIRLVLPKPDEEVSEKISTSVQDILGANPEITNVELEIGAREQKQTPGQQTLSAAPKILDVKYHVAVASGKGGVGKSTVAVNMAIAISRLRENVGLLDADVYGPSIPTMLGINDRPMATEDQKIIPLEKHGLKLISMGFLVNEDDAIIWRGPMVHGAIKQFVEDVEWTGTDYLVIDLPPGTGDAHLSLIQNVPLSGGVIVTTPQDVALIDVKRGVNMFRKLNVPILGIVENMSYLETPKGEIVDIFGKGGGRRMAEHFEVPFLGEIPIDPEICKGGDSGIPIIVSNPESKASVAFMEIAEKVLSRIEKD